MGITLLNKNLLAQPKNRHFCVVTKDKTHNSLACQKDGNFLQLLQKTPKQFEVPDHHTGSRYSSVLESRMTTA